MINRGKFMNKDIEDIHTCTVQCDKEEIYEMLRNLPDNDTLHKCHHCNYIFDLTQGGQANILTILRDRSFVYCPRCGTRDPELMCKVDAYSVVLKIRGKNCRKGTVISGTDLCPICNRPMCPDCYNHSVVSLSRVTGYVQDVSGWNNGKRQELLDRKRYTIMA
jgi:anaerobic ribonucleoside-triphosphate reductase